MYARDGRLIRGPGCVNFRDAGGYETSSGLAIPRGRIFRSGEHSGIDPETVRRIDGELGIRTIVDLRTSLELRVFGAGSLSKIERVARWHMPLFETIRPEWELPTDATSSATADRYQEMLDDGAPTILRLFRRLGHGDAYPILIHCAAGRDRTGIVIALMLSLLGVDRDVVAADYALSAVDTIEVVARAEPETMRLLLDRIASQHGSVRGWLLAQGVNEDDLSRFEHAVQS